MFSKKIDVYLFIKYIKSKRDMLNTTIVSIILLLFANNIAITNNSILANNLDNNKVLYIDNSGKLATTQITSDELTQIKNEVELLRQEQNNIRSQLNSLYPIGSIYISTNPISPATFLNGIWEKLPDGYYLRASDIGDGTILGESLPNVKGDIGDIYMYVNRNDFSGAFSNRSNGINVHWGDQYSSTTNYQYGIQLDLSKGNSIYQDNAPVRPKSIKVYMWRRTQ